MKIAVKLVKDGLLLVAHRTGVVPVVPVMPVVPVVPRPAVGKRTDRGTSVLSTGRGSLRLPGVLTTGDGMCCCKAAEPDGIIQHAAMCALALGCPLPAPARARSGLRLHACGR